MSAVTLHEVATSRHLIGIACERCMHHAMLSALKGPAVDDARTLEAGLYCGKCGSRKFTVMRFKSRSAAHAFMRNL
jgi:hypothetical protein